MMLAFRSPEVQAVAGSNPIASQAGVLCACTSHYQLWGGSGGGGGVHSVVFTNVKEEPKSLCADVGVEPDGSRRRSAGYDFLQALLASRSLGVAASER